MTSATPLSVGPPAEEPSGNADVPGGGSLRSRSLWGSPQIQGDSGVWVAVEVGEDGFDGGGDVAVATEADQAVEHQVHLPVGALEDQAHPGAHALAEQAPGRAVRPLGKGPVELGSERLLLP